MKGLNRKFKTIFQIFPAVTIYYKPKFFYVKSESQTFCWSSEKFVFSPYALGLSRPFPKTITGHGLASRLESTMTLRVGPFFISLNYNRLFNSEDLDNPNELFQHFYRTSPVKRRVVISNMTDLPLFSQYGVWFLFCYFRRAYTKKDGSRNVRILYLILSSYDWQCSFNHRTFYLNFQFIRLLFLVLYWATPFYYAWERYDFRIAKVTAGCR